MAKSYNETFFAEQQNSSQLSASHVVPLIMEMVQPTSVIDIGSGVGAWASEFQKRGVKDIRGVDGAYVNIDWLVIPRECFTIHDLTTPYSEDRNYDLVVCLEVAEHLPEASAQQFVDTLTKLSPLVLFSAAIPWQGGTHHFNEQWQDYWAEKFGNNGYIPIDCIRRKIWNNEEVKVWYRQNTVLYVQRDALANYPRLIDESNSMSPFPISIVHPICYAHPNNVTILRAGELLVAALRRRFARISASLKSKRVK